MYTQSLGIMYGGVLAYRFEGMSDNIRCTYLRCFVYLEFFEEPILGSAP